jgi:hypothetical protein
MSAFAPEADVGEWPLSGIENAFLPQLLTSDLYPSLWRCQFAV